MHCIYDQYPGPNLDIWIKGMGRQLHSTAGPQLEPLKLWYGLVITFHHFSWMLLLIYAPILMAIQLIFVMTKLEHSWSKSFRQIFRKSFHIIHDYAYHRVPTGPYFREKSLFSIVALPALEKSLLLNIFDRSPGKVLIFNRCVKTWMINIVLRKLRFSKCCGNDVELFGNPSDPLTNHRWRVVWRHLVPAKIPRASFIKFYYVVTLSQLADTWCHVVVVRNLIGPQSRRYTWRTLRKTSSIFVEIRQHT